MSVPAALSLVTNFSRDFLSKRPEKQLRQLAQVVEHHTQNLEIVSSNATGSQLLFSSTKKLAMNGKFLENEYKGSFFSIRTLREVLVIAPNVNKKLPNVNSKFIVCLAPSLGPEVTRTRMANIVRANRPS